MSPIRFTTAALGLAVFASSASADFLASVTPTFRGAPCATYGNWETFTSAYAAPNSPDVAGSNSAAALTQLIPGAILTSTGNIYHPSQIPAFRLEDSVSADALEVVLQVATLGNPRNPGSFILTYTDANQQTVILAPTQSVVLLSNVPTREELYFRWDLSGQADTVLAYRIDWVSSAANTALTSVLLDVRVDCPPGTAQCFGDGTGSACPCANAGAAGNGCANSVVAAGANLTANGGASVANDSLVLVGTGMPNSSCLYFQGSSATSVAFGDGLRCAGGAVIRLGTTSNTAGSSQYPGVGQQPVSIRGAIAAGDARVYQAWYRNAASFCTASTFNLSNGYRVTWAP